MEGQLIGYDLSYLKNRIYLSEEGEKKKYGRCVELT